MKLTKSQIKQIIKEELEAVLGEANMPSGGDKRTCSKIWELAMKMGDLKNAMRGEVIDGLKDWERESLRGPTPQDQYSYFEVQAKVNAEVEKKMKESYEKILNPRLSACFTGLENSIIEDIRSAMKKGSSVENHFDRLSATVSARMEGKRPPGQMADVGDAGAPDSVKKQIAPTKSGAGASQGVFEEDKKV